MAEELEWPDSGTVSSPGVDPAAVALALGGASRAKADAFLDDQRKVLQLQAKELAHELKLRHWSLQLRHASAILKFALEISIALIAIAVACFIGAVVWSAAHADGLVIESFSVPPDLAAHGLTGEVVASRMLDQLTDIQNATSSVRAPQSFVNDWDNNIKVEIPETGVSFGEAYSYLKGLLGHETHVGGEVIRTDSGISLTARVGGDSGATIAGTEADFDGLVEKAAEDIYGRTQPYRYAVYLSSNRADQALALFQHLAAAGPEKDRPWGYIGWSNILRDSGPPDMSMRAVEHALALQPDNMLALENMDADEITSSRPARALAYAARAQSGPSNNGQGLIRPEAMPRLRLDSEAITDGLMGDFQKAALEGRGARTSYGFGALNYALPQYETGQHDLTAARADLVTARAGDMGTSPGFNALWSTRAQMVIDDEVQNWAEIVSLANGLAPLFQKFPGTRFWSLTMTAPLSAYAQARLGEIATAEAEIAPTPDDCYDCLIARGKIADIEGQHARADWWYARAVAADPSLPFTDQEWGEALLARGDPDAAIAKFTLANQKGPHFADPLEGWGEALMAKNRSHLALAKFEDANTYAPNWGRLHLKWGEALAYAGKPDDAKKQYAIAAGLDLVSADKAELMRVMHG